MAEEILTVFKYETQQAIANIKNLREEVEKTEQAEDALSKAAQEAQKKRLKLFDEEVADLKELKKRREEASSVEEIEEYNKRIAETQKRVKVLADATGKLTEEQEAAAKAAREQAAAEKKKNEESEKSATVMGILDKLTFGYASNLVSAYKQTMTLVKGMKAFKVALAGTGIGLLVVALVSLISYFKNTQRGADLLSRIFKGFGAAISVITDRFSAFGETIVNAFKNPQQALKDFGDAIQQFLINRVNDILGGFKGLGEAVKLLFEGKFAEAAKTAGKSALDLTTGFTLLGGVVKDNIDTFKDIGREIAEEAKKAYELEAAMQRLIDAERELSVVRAKSRAEIKEQNLIAEDVSRSFEEREAAARRALAIEQDLMGQRLKLAEERVRITREQIALGESSREDLQELADAEIELANVREESLELQTTIQNKINAIRQSAIAEEQRRLKEIADAQKAAYDLAIALVEDAAARELAILEQQYLQKLIGERQYNEEVRKIALIRIEQLLSLEQEGTLRYEELRLQRLQIEAEFAQKSIDLQKRELDQKRADLEDAFKKELLIEEYKLLTNEQSEKKYQEAVRDINQNRIDELLKLEQEGTTAYQTLVNEKIRIDQEYAEKVKELEDKIREKRKETAEKSIESGMDAINTILEAQIAASDRAVEAIEKNSQKTIDARNNEIDLIDKRISMVDEANAERLENASKEDKKRIEREIENEKNRLLSERTQKEELIKIEEERAAKAIAIEKKRAQDFKRIQLSVMLIHESVALARAFSDLGPIAGAVAAVALGLKFAVLFAQIETAQFAKGTDYVQRGKNKPGVDTVPAMLTEGEAVITREQNRKYPGVAKAWNRGALDDYIEKNYVWPKLREYIGLQRMNTSRMASMASKKAASDRDISAVLNDGRIVAGLRELGRIEKRSSEKNARIIVEALNKKPNRRGT